MRVAALYDIHGNLPALAAVLAEVDRQEPDVILVGGDVALGPMPRETLELLMARGDRVRWLRGNCDREMAAAAPASTGAPRTTPASGAWGERTAWAAARCTLAQRQLLANLPTSQVLNVDDVGPVLFCHGSPRADDEIMTCFTPEARLTRMLTGVTQTLIVSGHTHVQYDRRAADRRLVNPGSVGMPYAMEPDARWAMVGPDVRLMRTPYDVAEAISGTRGSGLPDAEEFIGRYLVQRPAPDEASRFFEDMATRREQHA